MTTTVDHFSRYLTLTKTGLIAELARVSTNVAAAHLDLAHMLVEEQRARMYAYGQPASSVKALELNADIAASNPHEEVIESRGTLAALTEERDFLLLLIKNVKD